MVRLTAQKSGAEANSKLMIPRPSSYRKNGTLEDAYQTSCENAAKGFSQVSQVFFWFSFHEILSSSGWLWSWNSRASAEPNDAVSSVSVDFMLLCQTDLVLCVFLRRFTADSTLILKGRALDTEGATLRKTWTWHRNGTPIRAAPTCQPRSPHNSTHLDISRHISTYFF